MRFNWVFDFHCGDISCGNEKMAVNIWGEGLFLPSDFSLTHIRSLRQLVLRLERTACRIDRRERDHRPGRHGRESRGAGPPATRSSPRLGVIPFQSVTIQ